jgi:broad-specificity NMP kinase
LAADLWSDPYAIRSHVGPDGVLRKCGLVDVRAADGPVRPSLLDHALMLPDRVLSHLLGDDEPRSEWLTRERVARDVDQLTHQPLTAAALSRAALASVVVLTGAPGRGRRTTALALAGTEEVVVFVGDIAEGTLDDAVLEARISRSPLVITDADVLAERVGGHHVVVAVQTLSVAGHRVLLTSATSWHHAIDAAADWHDVELPEPAYRERVLLWREALVGAGLDVDPDEIATVADTYVLGPAQIHAAANSAADLRECDADALSRAARARSTHSLARLARQVDTPYTWKDLVLPARTTKLLDEIVSAVRHRPRVQQEWQMTRRRGMAILFSGPSGTGKTMSASLIAAELRVDLFAVDLAAVVSKYIGETEKNLDAVFTEARSSNAMLLFDEADALFGRRSETKDAHDRYANLEVAYLLQRMEAYDGLTVLTTNLRTNVDEAFARRFAFTVDFPPPDAGMRARIWRVAIPLHVPLADDVDLDQLADWIDLTGSGIANSALAAAYLAAAEDEPIAMQHLVRGVGRELQKSGRTPSRAAFGSYYRYLIEPSEVAESPSAAP